MNKYSAHSIIPDFIYALNFSLAAHSSRVLPIFIHTISFIIKRYSNIVVKTGGERFVKITVAARHVREGPHQCQAKRQHDKNQIEKRKNIIPNDLGSHRSAKRRMLVQPARHALGVPRSAGPKAVFGRGSVFSYAAADPCGAGSGRVGVGRPAGPVCPAGRRQLVILVQRRLSPTFY